MSSYSTSDFKPGLKIMLDGDPYNIVSNEFVKPGKGQAFSYLVNAGIYVFEPSIFKYLPRSGEAYLEEDIFPKLAQIVAAFQLIKVRNNCVANTVIVKVIPVVFNNFLP